MISAALERPTNRLLGLKLFWLPMALFLLVPTGPAGANMSLGPGVAEPAASNALAPFLDTQMAQRARSCMWPRKYNGCMKKCWSQERKLEQAYKCEIDTEYEDRSTCKPRQLQRVKTCERDCYIKAACR